MASASGAFQQVGGEGSDVFLAGVPGAHQTAATFTDEVVEEPPFVPKRLDDRLGQIHEHTVYLSGEQDPRARASGNEVVE